MDTEVLERDIKSALSQASAGDGRLARRTVAPWLTDSLITARDHRLFQSVWTAAGGVIGRKADAHGAEAFTPPPAFVRIAPAAWGDSGGAGVNEDGGGGSGGGGSGGGGGESEGCRCCVEYVADGGWSVVNAAAAAAAGGAAGAGAVNARADTTADAGVGAGARAEEEVVVVVAVVGAAHVDGIVARWNHMVLKE